MFSDIWEMAYSEQAALEGVLSLTRPKVAVEIGTYRGGSLNRIAAHCDEVHTFDLATHVSEHLPNVHYHIGDSRELLPRVLRECERSGTNVDFALIDGDHERSGVHRDMANLLQSSALQRTVILVHDTANEAVRAGIQDADLHNSHIAYANLSFVAPWRRPGLIAEAWGGLGIIVLDRDGGLWEGRRRLDENVDWPTALPTSLPWRAARPLRAVKRQAMYRLRPAYRRMRGTRGVRALHDSGPPDVPTH